MATPASLFSPNFSPLGGFPEEHAALKLPTPNAIADRLAAHDSPPGSFFFSVFLCVFFFGFVSIGCCPLEFALFKTVGEGIPVWDLEPE